MGRAGLLSCTVGRLVFKVRCQAVEFLKGPPWSWGSTRRTLNTLKLFAVNLSGASQCLLVCFVGGKVNSSQTACAEYPPTSYFVIRKAKLETRLTAFGEFHCSPPLFQSSDFRRQSR